MQVILICDLKGKGKKGDVIDVNPTYAINVLFKKNIAIPANASNLNDNKGKNVAKDFHHGEEVKKCEKLRDEMLKKEFRINLKIGENGKAFGSITKQEVLNCLNKSGFNIEKRQIKDFEPIKSHGDYKICLELMKEVKFEINIKII